MVQKICINCNKVGLNYAKGLCFDCYTRLYARKQSKKVIYANYHKEYISAHKQLYSKAAKKHYSNNTLKHINRITTKKKCQIRKEFCLSCQSNQNLEYHHINYDKNTDSIIVLCRACHRKLHRK